MVSLWCLDRDNMLMLKVVVSTPTIVCGYFNDPLVVDFIYAFQRVVCMILLLMRQWTGHLTFTLLVKLVYFRWLLSCICYVWCHVGFPDSLYLKGLKSGIRLWVVLVLFVTCILLRYFCDMIILISIQKKKNDKILQL